MFRYKTNHSSKAMGDDRHHINKMSRSSSSSCSSKEDGMDPCKDSWVFTKDASGGHRKAHGHRHHHHHHHHSRRSNNQDITSSELDEESLSDRNSATTSENMKVNVQYRGMVYKIRGLKILCSVFAGIVLLLTAVIILGVWIILGANEDGSFYFPWAARPSTNETIKSTTESTNIHEIIKVGSILSAIESNENVPDTNDLNNFKLPSMENDRSERYQTVTPQEEEREPSTAEMYDSEYYYDTYDDEYYVNDPRTVQSVRHPTSVDAPPEFSNYVPHQYEYEEEVAHITQPSQDPNDFRVYIGEEPPSTEIIISSSKEKDSSFKPSPRIPEYGVPNSEFVTFDDSDGKVIKITETPVFFHKRRDDEHQGPPVSLFHSQDRRTGIISDRLEETFTRPNEYKEEEHREFRRPSNPSEEDRISHLRRDHVRESAVPAQQGPFMRGEAIVDSRLYFESGHPKLSKFEEVNAEQIEEDPHRKLFIGGSYDSSEIILDHDEHPRRDMPLFERSEESPIEPVNHPEMKVNIPVPTMRSEEFISRLPSERQLPPHIRQELLRRRIAASRDRHQQPSNPPLRFKLPGSQPNHPPQGKQMRRIILERRPTFGPFMTPPEERVSRGDSQIAESITRPSIVTSEGVSILPKRNLPMNVVQPHHQSHKEHSVELHSYRPSPRRPTPELKPIVSSEKPETNSFFGALSNMYDYSKRLAGSLITLPRNLNTNDFESSGFLKESFSLLRDYDNVFQSLPRVLTEPLRMLQLPTAAQVDKLNPFELSLMTWTFIDFWEFLIEKVGTLSKRDLKILEARLERIRQQKDSNFARSFIHSTPEINEAFLDAEHNKTLEMIEKLKKEQADEALTTPLSTETEQGKSYTELWSTLNYFNDEERVEFMHYAMRTLFNFGKVYLRSDYAMDCMMLLFCKDINAETRAGGMEGMAAKLKSVGLKVLVDKEGREVDTVTSVWQALTKWEPLMCEDMFPKCDGSKALEIVNEVANASRK